MCCLDCYLRTLFQNQPHGVHLGVHFGDHEGPRGSMKPVEYRSDQKLVPYCLAGLKMYFVEKEKKV